MTTKCVCLDCSFVCLLGVIVLAGCGGGSSGGSGKGNDILPLALPFEYTVDSQTLQIPTAGGTVYVSVGPYGSHFQPLSGDLIGDAKSNMIGFFANDRSQLAERPGSGGNGDGICDPNETCAFAGSADDIRALIPTYIAPADARLDHVRLNSGPIPGYFDSPMHWEIVMYFNSRYSMRIGHLAEISPTLRNKILAATGIDTDTYSGPTGVLFQGADIAIAAGDELATPHVSAREVTGQPGYYIGLGDVPWAQMEFTVADHREGADVCVFDLIDSARKSEIQNTMAADMANPESFRYGPYAATAWVWGAEGLLCPVYSPRPTDFRSIHTRFGGWTERPQTGTTVDELFAIVKIEKDSSTIYDAANYDSADVDHLATRGVGPGLPSFSWVMPDSAVVNPFIAVGEVIEESADSLLIKWRDIGWTGPVYQRAAFLLDGRGLKIRWGNFAVNPGGAVKPLLNAADACNDSDTICYDHQHRL